jgi:hypothetical protein
MPRRRLFPVAVCLLACCFAAVAAPFCHAAAPGKSPLRVTHRGSVTLPDKVRDIAGNDVAITGLSGIAWLGDNRYAAIMDNSDRLVLFSLTIARDGMPEEPTDIQVLTLSERHDYEDVAPCPEPLQKRIAGRRCVRASPTPAAACSCRRKTPRRSARSPSTTAACSA